MAHVVGVPRRDPCQKCKFPVFLAERLAVGKKVYHRTCLRCARCNSQLTPGSFYETEVDDEYCCETCPDEEKDAGAVVAASVELRREDRSPDHAMKPVAVRRSIADRLAFFEQNRNGSGSIAATATSLDSKLLQKNISDEEKSKSLQRTEGAVGYKPNSAFSNFVNDAANDASAESASAASVGDGIDSEATSSCADTPSHKNDTVTSESEDEADGLSGEMDLPALPKTQPPMIGGEQDSVRLDPILRIVEDEDDLPAPLFTAKAQVKLVKDGSSEDAVRRAASSESEKALQKKEEAVAAAATATATTIKQKTEITLQLSTEKMPTNDHFKSNNSDNHHNHNSNINSDDIVSLPALVIVEDANDVATAELESSLEFNDKKRLTKEETAEVDAQQMSANDGDDEQMKASDVALNESAAGTGIETGATLGNSASTCTANGNVELRTKSSTHSSPKQPVSISSRADEDIETTKRLSVVRARLHQFEVNANNNNEDDVPELVKHKSNQVDEPRVNARNSYGSDKEASTEGVKSLEYLEELIKATELALNHHETEKILKQVPENENDRESLAIGEPVNNAVETDKEKMSIRMEEAKMAEVIVEEVKVEEAKAEEAKVVEVGADGVKVAEEAKVEETKVEEGKMEEEVNVDDPKVEEAKVEAAEAQHVTTAESVPEINLPPAGSVSATSLSNQSTGNLDQSSTTTLTAETSRPRTPNIKRYPSDLNPFQSDDDDKSDENSGVLLRRTPASTCLQSAASKKQSPQQQHSLNPFDSSDDEIELEKSTSSTAATTPTARVPPPRPPPPRISRNPFGDEAEEDSSFSRRSSLSSSLIRRTPVPTPRSNLSRSQNPTPEPTPRLGSKSLTPVTSTATSPALLNASDDYGSANSLSTPQSLYRNSDIRGSNISLTSSAGGTIRSRKARRAPAPPSHPTVKELFPSPGTEHSANLNTSSQPSTPGSSTVGSPKPYRKKRPAPAPPKPARLDPALTPNTTVQPQPQLQQQRDHQPHHLLQDNQLPHSKNSFSYPLQSELDSKLSDEEKTLLEGKVQTDCLGGPLVSQRSSLRLIPLDASLLQDEDDPSAGGKSDDVKYKENEEELNVVYRRMLVPPTFKTPTHEGNPLFGELNESPNRQLEKLKDNKEAKNRNRQSQASLVSSGAEDSDPLYNKSSHGKWKRRKGPAPALPIPPRKVLQMLPLQEIKHELEIIEVQQQGLEKQGVILEKMIRDRCEGGAHGESPNSGVEEGASEGGTAAGVDVGGSKTVVLPTANSKEVEDLILQLFELVNEKNELFRRQAELMYLRRQHRLEQEQADIEYEIRVLMAQPERNKTDSDKAREEALIARLVEVVQLRNEVVERLEMDRLREAEEDMSIKKRLELHTAGREGSGESKAKTSTTKLSKKEKKKQKETKKLAKSKKIDVDKDADDTELSSDKLKTKKKRKKFLF